MSVTFSIEGNFTGDFTATCHEQNLTLGPVTGYDAIGPLLTAHKAECEECAHYGIYSTSVMDVSDEFDVNVANVNARLLLAAMGITTEDGDLAGTVDGETFLGSVLLAMGTSTGDTGVASAVIGGRELGQRGATMIDCGLPAGYFAERYAALAALATEAVRLGRSVTFS